MVASIRRRLWSWPVEALSLAANTVDLWTVSLHALEEHGTALTALLSNDEQERAERYRFPQHRQRFGLTRGALRLLLGNYLGRQPCDIELKAGEHGKPTLPPNTKPQVGFNLSHSRDIALFAFGRDVEVGVDIEYLDATLDRDAIVLRVFSMQERACYEASAADQRLACFFRIWTRNEARLKAVGLGAGRAHAERADELAVVNFEVGSDYLGALALGASNLGIAL